MVCTYYPASTYIDYQNPSSITLFPLGCCSTNSSHLRLCALQSLSFQFNKTNRTLPCSPFLCCDLENVSGDNYRIHFLTHYFKDHGSVFIHFQCLKLVVLYIFVILFVNAYFGKASLIPVSNEQKIISLFVDNDHFY